MRWFRLVVLLVVPASCTDPLTPHPALSAPPVPPLLAAPDASPTPPVVAAPAAPAVPPVVPAPDAPPAPLPPGASGASEGEPGNVLDVAARDLACPRGRVFLVQTYECRITNRPCLRYLVEGCRQRALYGVSGLETPRLFLASRFSLQPHPSASAEKNLSAP